MPFIISTLLDFVRRGRSKGVANDLPLVARLVLVIRARESGIPTLIDGDFSLGKWALQICSSNVERELRLTKPCVPHDGQGHYKILADEESLELTTRKVEGEFR